MEKSTRKVFLVLFFFLLSQNSHLIWFNFSQSRLQEKAKFYIRRSVINPRLVSSGHFNIGFLVWMGFQIFDLGFTKPQVKHILPFFLNVPFKRTTDFTWSVYPNFFFLSYLLIYFNSQFISGGLNFLSSSNSLQYSTYCCLHMSSYGKNHSMV